MDLKIHIDMALTEQDSACIVFEVDIYNRSEMRLLLPRPEVTAIQFENSLTKETAIWGTHYLVSRSWYGFTLDSGDSKKLEYRVRPSGAQEPPDTDYSDYGRWCLDLAVGYYSVWFEMKVDKGYFCPDSHLRLPDLRKIAAERQATVWMGLVNTPPIQVEVHPRRSQ